MIGKPMPDGDTPCLRRRQAWTHSYGSNERLSAGNNPCASSVLVLLERIAPERNVWVFPRPRPSHHWATVSRMPENGYSPAVLRSSYFKVGHYGSTRWLWGARLWAGLLSTASSRRLPDPELEFPPVLWNIHLPPQPNPGGRLPSTPSAMDYLKFGAPIYPKLEQGGHTPAGEVFKACPARRAHRPEGGGCLPLERVRGFSITGRPLSTRSSAPWGSLQR